VLRGGGVASPELNSSVPFVCRVVWDAISLEASGVADFG